jgi:hypothetical protein
MSRLRYNCQSANLYIGRGNGYLPAGSIVPM